MKTFPLLPNTAIVPPSRRGGTGQRVPARRRRVAGTALAITMLGLFVLSVSTMFILTLCANALHGTNKLRSMAGAFNAAEVGADEGALWLKSQATPPRGNAMIRPFTTPQTLGEGTYDVSIFPDPNNNNAFLKTYRIVSKGVVRSETKTVEIVIKQSSFGRYAYFTDSETSMGGGNIYWKAGDRVDGPAHSNNRNNSRFNIDYTNSANAIFQDTLTSVAGSINYTPASPRGDTTFKKIFKDGSKGFKLGVGEILLPDSSDQQKTSAWGASGGFPTSGTTGVYLRANANGGIYIHGDSAVTFSVNALGNQVIVITQGYNTTTLTLDRVAKTITAVGPVGLGSPLVTTSLGTGVIYSDGNITSLKGEIADNLLVNGLIDTRSAFTVATDVNAGKSIRITNNLRYRTQPNKLLDSIALVNQTAGTLGLVAKDIIVDDAAPANLEIDAVMLAGGNNTQDGSFYVENYANKTPTGTLTLTGGIIQKVRGAVGTFNPTYGTIRTGYDKAYSYDTRLANDPPPFFPTTGQYERVSWQVVPDGN